MPKITMVNVYQGKHPLGSFESEGEAKAFIDSQKISCRARGIDCNAAEFKFSTKVHTVTVEPEVVA